MTEISPLKHPPFLDRMQQITSLFIFTGFVAGVLSLLLGFENRMWHAYLVNYVYFLLMAVGGLFFISLHHVCKAGWSANVRRLAEALPAYLPWAALLMLPLLWGAFSLYDWLDPQKILKDPLLQHKRPYLNFPFFLIRVGLFLGGWWFFFKKLVGFSLKQDKDGDMRWTHKSLKCSIMFLFFFAFSLSFFSVDFLMSLDAHWFSTIFGVYVFAGLFQSVFAATILLAATLLKLNSSYRSLIKPDHFHDMGKFLFAATVFWAYIAFSQYMLIWYANLPEETTFFLYRSQGWWAWVSVSLIVGKFILPFLVLLPRESKRNLSILVPVAVFILLMQWIDLYWLIYPHFDPKIPRWGVLELALFLGFLGLFLKSVFLFLSQHPVIPLKDPMAKESSSHHVTY